jgi:O-6-methylguanine DNA methyltransferase
VSRGGSGRAFARPKLKIRYRGTCFTGIVKVGKREMRVAWTNAGIAFVDDAADAPVDIIERRIKMRLVDKPVPKPFQDELRMIERTGKPHGMPLDLSWATDYERDVLYAATTIPWGQTRPYSWLARQARRPLAVRAAASAIARNPLWLLVPCHRVISAGGKIGSYGSSGVARKRELLKREGVHL